jgi:hypothetical protein
MKKLAVVFGIVFATACGNKADKALSEMEGFKDKMCECKDKACVDSVQSDMLEWSKKMKDSGIEKSDLSDAQKERGKEIEKAMSECRREARKNK